MEKVKLTKKQELAMSYMINRKNVFVTSRGGTGKCMGFDTPVIMYDGTIKMIQDIIVGDLVMGDDSSAREVLATDTGEDIMYEVSTIKGDSYIVNSNHILTFKSSKTLRWEKHEESFKAKWGDISGVVKTKYFENEEDGKKFLEDKPDLVDFPILEVIEKNKKRYWNEHFQGVYTGLTFPDKEVDLDPYLLGVWLGDGDSNNSFITNIDPEIIEFIYKYCETNYLHIRQGKRTEKNRNDYHYYIRGSILGDVSTNPFLVSLKKYKLLNNKHIPPIYKTNSREKRLKLLAGLIDTDGYLHHNSFEITQKNKVLAYDIYFVAKSLGYQVSINECEKSCIYKGEKRPGIYQRLLISGNTDEIPVLIKRKRALPRKQIKNHLVSRIEIKCLGKGKYYGIEIGGNHRYVLGNFIITHNSFLIKLFKNIYQSTRKIAMTSTTGTSALLIGGCTLHSYLGIGLGRGSADDLSSIIFKNKFVKKRWLELEVLIIDEISMMTPELFDKLEEVARTVRMNDKPFGGIQLILTGDGLQLPCVDSDELFFQAKSWEVCVEHTVYLNEIFRQRDATFQKCLNEVRMAEMSEDTIKILKSRIGVKLENEFNITPTTIFSLNYKVDELNNQELDKLSANDNLFYEYNMEYDFLTFTKDKQQTIERFKKNCIAPEQLQICVGAQVMLLKNLDVENGLANGSRGIVTKFIEDKPVVKFLCGIEKIIDYDFWTLEEGKVKVLQAKQIPLKVAFAISIHKCITGNSLIFTDSGLKRISKISDSLEDHKSLETKEISMNIMGKNGFGEATQIYKGEIEDTIRISTSYGFVIEGSHRHPIMTYNGEEVWKTLPEIVVGDSIMLKNNLQCFGKNIDTFSFKSTPNTKVKYTIPSTVEEKLCYIIGLLIGDGCYSTKNNFPVEIVVDKTCNEIKDTYLQYFYEIFGRKCNVYDNGKTTYKLMVNSKDVREFLYWCGLYYHTAEYKTIPWVVFENTKASQISCLRGLFDSDGGVNTIVHFTSVSHQLVVDVQCLLLNIGIVSSIKKLTNNSMIKHKQAYRLNVCGYQAHLFYLHVGFIDKKKQTKLENQFGLYDKIPKAQACYIPNSYNLIKMVREEIYSFHKTKRCNYIPGKCSKLITNILMRKVDITHSTLKYICEQIIDIEKYGPTGKKIKDIVNNNFFFDKVVVIETGKDMLYDFYVPSDHTFIANGIVNHNCQGVTLDYCIMDLSDVFTYGQAYVALSRVKSLEGLSITGLDVSRIQAHPIAKEYYKNLEKEEYL